MKILIGVDDSTCSVHALESIVERKWPEDTEFRVITVVEPIVVTYGFAGCYVTEMMLKAEKEIVAHSKHLIDEATARLKAVFGETKVSGDVLHGYIADSIIEEAKAWDADLIVVGSHGRKGFQRFFLGSVAERVASHSPCSIEIIKGKEVHRECDVEKVHVDSVRCG